MTLSLRCILVASLLLFALLPAAGVTWRLTRNSAASVGELTNQVLRNVTLRIQGETENHLAQAHAVMNGLFPESMTPQQVRQARAWLEQPGLFEPLAFALTRHGATVSRVYLATAKGDFFAVEPSLTRSRAAWLRSALIRW